MLVLVTVLAGEFLAPQRGIDFRDRRSAGWNLPTIEWPEMKTRAKMRSGDNAATAIRCESTWHIFTEPCTSKWKTDLARPARTSVNRRQVDLPQRAAPFPCKPSRTDST